MRHGLFTLKEEAVTTVPTLTFVRGLILSQSLQRQEQRSCAASCRTSDKSAADQSVPAVQSLKKKKKVHLVALFCKVFFCSDIANFGGKNEQRMGSW